ncbi:hypothetical protein D9757_003548 [Collybiopsis confluens]|uniref:Hydroxyneurosporene synthase n=1 Tax=Collybiopsis confluens TaxID=2823264 RepID=A0A8H5HTS9_9AGAR|nr:hypothetical protein D9757_005450 [Collybiopsis confluens]KAF5389323.1 hypothetical protein D9757_003548 [Collybiopsis confluens]
MRASNSGAILSLFLHYLLAVSASTTQYPSTVVDGDSIVQYIATSAIDAPKVSTINATSYDYWYFDAVSLDHEYSVVAVFYAAPKTSFPFLPKNQQILAAQISVQTPGAVTINTTYATAATLTVDDINNDIEGTWEGIGAAFTGTRNMTLYNVTFESEEQLGVSGFASFKSIAPPHYVCSPAEEGANMELLPHVGWANAIPDAHAIVELEINGTRVSFSGVGYHDKNWGDAPFQDAVTSWYWGHARVGPYSVVWFDAIASNGTEYASGYVARDGQILGIACGTDKAKVRPIGNTTYPPHTESNTPDGFQIEFDLGEDVGVFEATAKAEALALQSQTGVYSRWTGGISGGLRSEGKVFNGTSLFDQFALTS